MNRKIAAALGLPEDAEPGEIIRRARGLQNQINASTRVQMNAVAELRRVRAELVKAKAALEPFGALFKSIAQTNDIRENSVLIQYEGSIVTYSDLRRAFES